MNKRIRSTTEMESFNYKIIRSHLTYMDILKMLINISETISQRLKIHVLILTYVIIVYLINYRCLIYNYERYLV